MVNDWFDPHFAFTSSDGDMIPLAPAVAFMFVIRSEVNVAIPHFLGGNEAMKAIFLGGRFAILHTLT